MYKNKQKTYGSKCTKVLPIPNLQSVIFNIVKQWENNCYSNCCNAIKEKILFNLAIQLRNVNDLSKELCVPSSGALWR